MSEQILNYFNKEFSKCIAKPFYKAIEEYRLLKDGDKICVCISGGKDSLLLAALMKKYEQHGKIPISIKYLVMNPGFSDASIQLINRNTQRLGIEIEMFETDIFKLIEKEENPCFLCSKMRRGLLYKKAKELGCNKIALGHHFDDVIEGILMGILYGGQTQTMLPRVKSEHFDGMELIRPMCFVREKDVIEWLNFCGLEKMSCDCPLKEREENSKRKFVKQLIARLREDNPQIEMNIFRSVHNVRLDRIISYKNNGEIHDFLENFDDEN